MKIETHYAQRETLESFAEKHDLTMEIRERNPAMFGGSWKPTYRFFAKFKNSETKEGCCLVGSYGDGKSPAEAMENYAKEISGKLLVIDAYGKDKRREIQVPILM